MFCICMNINQICKNNRKSRAFLAVPPFFRKCTFSIRKWLKICLIYCTSVLSLLSQPSGDFERAERKVWVGSQQLHLSCTPCKHCTHFALHLCCTQCAHLAKHLCTMCTAGISGHAHPLQCTLCTSPAMHTVHCACTHCALCAAGKSSLRSLKYASLKPMVLYKCVYKYIGQA